MKKIFYLVCGLMIVFLTSCSSVKQGIAYNLTVTGDGDGNVKVEFPVGHYYMNGDADLDLLVTNDTTKHVVLSKQEVLESNNKKEIKAMTSVNGFMADKISATTAGGTYDLCVDGVVYEPITGLSFAVHKHLTNRDSTNLVPARNVKADPYMYIK